MNPPPPSDDRDSTIVVDVAALAVPDAATIDALARLQLVATADGRQIQLLHASPRLVELMALFGLSEVLPLHGGRGVR